MKVKTQIIEIDNKSLPFQLESGTALPRLSVAYEEYGKPNSEGSNSILVCHALTGEAHAAGASANTDEIVNRVPLLKSDEKRLSGLVGWPDWSG